MSRVIQIYQLRPGDKFEEIPRAWHGPGIVTEVSTRCDKGVPYITAPRKWGKYEWLRWKNPVMCVKFDNDKVVNPPGLFYSVPELKVRLLKRDGKPVRGRPHPLPKAKCQVEVREG